MKTSHEANNFPFLFSFFALLPLQSKQSPHHPILEHSKNTISLGPLLNVTEQVLRPHNKKQRHSCLYFNLHDFRKQMGRYNTQN
jgi:hypothetical protein